MSIHHDSTPNYVIAEKCRCSNALDMAICIFYFSSISFDHGMCSARSFFFTLLENILHAHHHLVSLYFHCITDTDGPLDLNYVADMVKKQREAPINEFEISHDRSSNTWHVEGVGLQRFVQMTNWRYKIVASLDS